MKPPKLKKINTILKQILTQISACIILFQKIDNFD